MADSLTDRPALATTRPAATGTRKHAVRLHERHGLCLLQVIARPGHERETGRILGLDLPGEPNTGKTVDAIRVFCLRPADWLIVMDDAPGRAGGVAVEARGRLAGHAAAIDQSHGRVVLELSGDGARALLQKGLNVDLHPSEFPEGSLAQAGLGGIAVMVHAVTASSFELYVARSFAASLADWLVHHGAVLQPGPTP